MLKFNCQSSSVGFVEDEVTEELIKSEPMLYGFSLLKAKENGGVLTKSILNLISSQPWFSNLVVNQAISGYHPVIDTKSVLLMEGQYPCIPGWHCDGVIRNKVGAQPDLSTLNEDVRHFVCTISVGGEHNGTAIPKIHEVKVEEDGLDFGNIWGSINDKISGIDYDETMNGEVVMFKRSCLHKGLPAKSRVWRYFFRMSFYHMPALNEIRDQVQIYCDVNKGW